MTGTYIRQLTIYQSYILRLPKYFTKGLSARNRTHIILKDEKGTELKVGLQILSFLLMDIVDLDLSTLKLHRVLLLSKSNDDVWKGLKIVVDYVELEKSQLYLLHMTECVELGVA